MISEGVDNHRFEESENCRSKFFVETMKGGISGSILAVARSERVAELKDFYIIEGPEDSGLRSKLLEKAVNYCRSQNISVIKTVIFPDLRHYFQKKGFTPQKRVINYLSHGEEMIVMTKNLRE